MTTQSIARMLRAFVTKPATTQHGTNTQSDIEIEVESAEQREEESWSVSLVFLQ